MQTIQTRFNELRAFFLVTTANIALALEAIYVAIGLLELVATDTLYPKQRLFRKVDNGSNKEYVK